MTTECISRALRRFGHVQARVAEAVSKTVNLPIPESPIEAFDTDTGASAFELGCTGIDARH